MTAEPQKLRIRFRKQGDLRWVGHRDLARTFERLFRRAEVPLMMSEGFHPHARINFPSALAVGIEGQQEWVEALVEGPLEIDGLEERLRQQAPGGLEIDQLWLLARDHPKPRVAAMVYEIAVPLAYRATATAAIEQFWAQSEYWQTRDGRSQPVNIRANLAELALDDAILRFTLLGTVEAQARPREILVALGLENLEQEGSWLVRTAVRLANP